MSEQRAVHTAASIDESATADLRTTAKWLCASAGAIVAVLVAGLQLGDVAGLEGARLGFAVSGAVAALASVLVVLLAAASVLASEGPPIQALADEDAADGGAYPSVRVEQPTTPLMKYLLVERRLELLGPRTDSISALIVSRIAAHDGLTLGKTVQIEGRTYAPSTSETDRADLQVIEEEIRTRITGVVNAADRWTTTKRFRTLRVTLACAGSVFLLGLLGYVSMVATAEPRSRVSRPISVTVVVPSTPKAATSAGFDAKCAGHQLSGVMVGGWLDEPQVVTVSSGGCPAQRLRPGRHAVVIPTP